MLCSQHMMPDFETHKEVTVRNSIPYQTKINNNPDFSKKCPGPVGSPKLTFHYMFLIPARSSCQPSVLPAGQGALCSNTIVSRNTDCKLSKRPFTKWGILYVVNLKRSKGGKQWDNKVKLYIFIISL